MRKKILAAILGILMIAGIFAVSAVAADERTDAYFIVNGVEYAWNEQTYLGAVGTGGISANNIKVVEVFNVNRANSLVFDMLIPDYTFQYCTIKLNNCTVNSGDGWTIGSKVSNGNIEVYFNNCTVEKLNINFTSGSKSATDLYFNNSDILDISCNNVGDAKFENCNIKQNVTMYNQKVNGNKTTGVNSKGAVSTIKVTECIFSEDCRFDGCQLLSCEGFYHVTINHIYYGTKIKDNQITFKYTDTNTSTGIALHGYAGTRFDVLAYIPYIPIDWHDEVITITTPEQLVEFAQVANGGANCNNGCAEGTKHSFEGQTIKLGKSLDLGTINGEEGWWYYQDENKKIDNRIVDFKGTFDGQGYTISKMKYYDYNGCAENDSGYVVLGMFRTLYGTVKNLTIATVGGHKTEKGLDPVIAVGPRVAFFPLAYKTRGAVVDGVKAIDVNVKIDNARYTYEQDALTSVNGLVGVVTWDNEDNYYGNTTQYSYFKNCTVEKFFAEITGNCGYAGGAFAYKASEMSVFENCNVKAAMVTIGGSVDNYGGFIGEIGLASVVTNCHVTNFSLTAAQNNYGVGGFMGDTVGGTGWGDSVHINDCTVSNSSIKIDSLNGPLGGFVGDLLGGRGTKYNNNVVESTVTLTVNGLAENSNYGVGGFIGGLSGRDNLTSNSEHSINNCSTYATINSNKAPAAGFVGAVYKPEKAQMRIVFDTCHAAATINANDDTMAIAFGFYSATKADGTPVFDLGSKVAGDKNYDEYINCTTASDTFGLKPDGEDQATIVGGESTYSRTLSNGYVELTDATATKTTYTTFQDPAMQTFRLRRAPVEIDKVVEVEFYRKNAAGEYELWRTIELFKDTAFDGTGYPYADTYADYRIAGGLASVLDEADELFVKATAIGFIDENGNPFTDSTIVGSDIKLYAEYGFEVTYEFEGSIPEGVTVPESKFYQTGETVELPTVSNVDNYEFRGWNVEAGYVMPEESVTITGKWVKVAKPQITGKVKYNGGLSAGQFTFVLIDENGEEVGRTTNDKDGNFKFNLKLDQGDTYFFTVKQIAGSETLQYDLSNFEVAVAVDNFGDAAIASEKIVFDNRAPYKAKAAIKGSVTLDGEAADGFKFVLTDRRGNVIATTESEDGEFRFDLTYGFTGKRYYHVKQVSADGVVCDDVVYEIEVVVKSIGSGYKAQVAYIGTEALEFSNTSAN